MRLGREARDAHAHDAGTLERPAQKRQHGGGRAVEPNVPHPAAADGHRVLARARGCAGHERPVVAHRVRKNPPSACGRKGRLAGGQVEAIEEPRRVRAGHDHRLGRVRADAARHLADRPGRARRVGALGRATAKRRMGNDVRGDDAHGEPPFTRERAHGASVPFRQRAAAGAEEPPGALRTASDRHLLRSASHRGAGAPHSKAPRSPSTHLPHHSTSGPSPPSRRRAGRCRPVPSSSNARDAAA